MYEEREYLALSGIQHYAFCPRQWALIHLEQQWSENVLTAQGSLMHERAHDELTRERRGDLLTVRGLGIHSRMLGVAGKCDVLEFRRSSDGVPLAGEDGLWAVTPVEYKHGKAKRHDADRLQLCAQALCLEEMLACDVPGGYLYYGQTRSREKVTFDADLRDRVTLVVKDMHRVFSRGVTPKHRPMTACRSCSIKEICVPNLARRETVATYLDRRLKEQL